MKCVSSLSFFNFFNRKIVCFSIVCLAFMTGNTFAEFIDHPVFRAHCWKDSTGLYWSAPLVSEDGKIVEQTVENANSRCHDLGARLPTTQEVSRISDGDPIIQSEEHQASMEHQGWSALPFHPRDGILRRDLLAVQCVMDEETTEEIKKTQEAFRASYEQVQAQNETPVEKLDQEAPQITKELQRIVEETQEIIIVAEKEIQIEDRISEKSFSHLRTLAKSVALLGTEALTVFYAYYLGYRATKVPENWTLQGKNSPTWVKILISPFLGITAKTGATYIYPAATAAATVGGVYLASQVYKCLPSATSVCEGTKKAGRLAVFGGAALTCTPLAALTLTAGALGFDNLASGLESFMFSYLGTVSGLPRSEAKLDKPESNK